MVIGYIFIYLLKTNAYEKVITYVGSLHGYDDSLRRWRR